MVTAADVKQIATEFDSVDNARVELFIAQAAQRVNRGGYGSEPKADTATIYLTAHLLTLDAQQGGIAPGPKSSERLDSYSVGYAIPAALGASSAVLASTGWGRAYMEIRRTAFARRDL
jgi:hypothetical protein